jgi:putative FmdB family regulatory protein
MPIYEYRCTACSHQIEVIQKLGDRPVRRCSRCGGRMEKLISRAAFQLKGGGWYSEGYSKGAKPSDSQGGSKTEAKADSKSEAKAETKSDAKPGAKSAPKPSGT